MEINNDVLLKVFEFLDGHSLKNAALVCENWNCSIESSPRTMKKLILMVDNEKKLKAKRKIERKHVNLCINAYEQNIIEVINRCDVSNVRSCCIFACSDNIILVTTILSQMPLLEEAKLEIHELKDINITSHDDVKTEMLKFKSLKRLKIYSSDCRIFKCIDAKKVDTLEIAELPRENNELHGTNALLGFLEHASALKNFELNKKLFFEIFRQKTNFACQLKTLKIRSCGSPEQNFLTDDDFVKNFESFLSTNCQNLNCFDGGDLNKILDKCVMTILKISKLLNLTIGSSCSPQEREEFENLKTLKALKFLTLIENFPSNFVAEGIFRLCPEIERLSLFMTIANEIEFIASQSIKLKKLYIES